MNSRSEVFSRRLPITSNTLSELRVRRTDSSLSSKTLSTLPSRVSPATRLTTRTSCFWPYR